MLGYKGRWHLDHEDTSEVILSLASRVLIFRLHHLFIIMVMVKKDAALLIRHRVQRASVLISSGRHWSRPHGHGDWWQGARNVIIRTGKWPAGDVRSHDVSRLRWPETPVLSHGAVSSLINTQLCHLQSLITVIPLSQAQEKHEKLREPLLTSYTIYDE